MSVLALEELADAGKVKLIIVQHFFFFFFFTSFLRCGKCLSNFVGLGNSLHSDLFT